MARFFLSKERFVSDETVLSEEESHHALHVMRLRVGDSLVVFDGEGREADAEVAAITREGAGIRITERRQSESLASQLVLVQAIPKGKNMELVIQKAVELGVAKIVPLVTERTIVRVEEGEKSRKQSKWQALAVEACKQCGQNFLPEVKQPMSLRDYLREEEEGGLRLVASLQGGARSFAEVIREGRERGAEGTATATILIGPEGDFAPEETAAIVAKGYLPVTLGPIVLRTETAAIYCLSVLAHELLR